MKRQLKNDVTRCQGKDCELRYQCQLFLTIIIDDEKGLYSYMSSRDDSHLTGKPCSSFMEDE